MKTQFAKISDKDFPHRWVRFFHTGTEWIQAYEILREEHRKNHGIWLPYVYSYALGIAVELFVKSIAAHENASFNPKKFGHKTTDIISTYKDHIIVLNKIAEDVKLMGLIKNYEDTVDTKFGDTTISIDGSDEQIVLDSAYEIRSEMCKRTKLR